MNETVAFVPERASLHHHAFAHVSSGRAVAYHAAPAFKLVVGVDSLLSVAQVGRQGEARAVLVGPGQAQSIGTPGVAVAFFVEPGSAFAPHRGAEGLLIPTGALVERLVAIARDHAKGSAEGDATRIAESYRALGLERSPRPDVRVERALGRLVVDPGASIAEVARDLGLSPERLRHLTAAARGVPLRSFRLWHRTIDATERVLAGEPIARAAADAGFADHAHFTRSFGGFFGRAPSTVAMETRRFGDYGARSFAAR